jgi:predicted nucleic acid-binding protein
VITLDTSGLVAYIATQDRNHAASNAVLEEDPGPYIIAVASLSEVTFMIERDFTPDIVQAFLTDLQSGAYALYWDERDIERIQDLTRRYHDLPLGFTDAAVISCAEQNGGRVLTTDRRHFAVVARGEKSIIVLPQS